MKTLYVVRHAKSSWEDISLSDHDRPLLPIGIKKTGSIVRYLVENGVKPELLVSSTAERAYQTARIIAEGLGYPAEKILQSTELYHASPRNILHELMALPDDVDSVMIFGHNPAFTYFINDYMEDTIDNLPTSGVACIRFDTEHWENLAESDHQLVFLITPKMLK